MNPEPPMPADLPITDQPTLAVTRISLEDVTTPIVAAFGDDLCLIWSGEHQAWWLPGSDGYTARRETAGLFTIASAYARTKHCGPEKQIMFERTHSEPRPVAGLREATCGASPDHADIMETIKNAADDWQKQGYTSALAEVRDMANVGRALMEALPKGYSYMNCPSEIVSDLQNERDEALSPSPASLEGGEGVIVCDHGIRSPWQCHDCDDANPPPPGYNPLFGEKLS